MEFKKSAGVVVYYLEGQEPTFLLLRYPTYWGFAKGIVEPGELDEDAAIREVKEESNLTVSLIEGFEFKQEWVYKFKGELIKREARYFLAKITKEESKNVKISWEHNDFAWKTLDEAKKVMKVKQNKEMLEKANQFITEYEKQKRLT
jgi:8-oxo-dGTP pyrophosphatase MutT (NUDIX family)